VNAQIELPPTGFALNPDGISLRGCLHIYAPAGQAAEYAPLAANPYRGCGHGCVYCYVPPPCLGARRVALGARRSEVRTVEGGNLGAHLIMAPDASRLRSSTGRRSALYDASRPGPPKPCSTAASFQPRSQASPIPVFTP
jgi:hypothetical protein